MILSISRLYRALWHMSRINMIRSVLRFVAWAVVVQNLPTIATLNTSLYVVYAGYQDYFFSLYESVLTPQETLQLVTPVVEAIVDLIEVHRTINSVILTSSMCPIMTCNFAQSHEECKKYCTLSKSQAFSHSIATQSALFPLVLFSPDRFLI